MKQESLPRFTPLLYLQPCTTSNQPMTCLLNQLWPPASHWCLVRWNCSCNTLVLLLNAKASHVPMSSLCNMPRCTQEYRHDLYSSANCNMSQSCFACDLFCMAYDALYGSNAEADQMHQCMAPKQHTVHYIDVYKICTARLSDSCPKRTLNL